MENVDFLKAMREMKVDRKADQERMEDRLKEEIQSNQANAEANQARMEESLKEEMRLTVSAIEKKMEAIVHSIRSERDERTQDWSENVTERQKIPKEGATVASLERKEQDPKELESGAECQEVPTEKATVKSLRITKKRPRGRHIAAERRIKPTKMTQGDCESRRRLVAACRKVSRCAAVAWHGRNIVRDIQTQGNFGPRQKLGAAGIMVTLHARLAPCKGTFAQKDPTRDSVKRGAYREWAVSERHHTKPTGCQGIRNQSSKQQVCLRKEGTTMNDIGAWTSGQQLLPGSGRMHMKALYEMGSVKIAKQNAGSSARLWSIKD
jgi:hypothetical protein